ncbi:expressed unknown protein [Seminavis robusta]|uniref:Uncharacterized protein n=1 Tax=Seminavis robusta TaxID=568900 RepID=A0A9N8E017_9STRA|nr:expressed unknown protein [Seminavis robusta]|eukprot:Sro512_g157600.1 n/a (154) ;mRNA; f:22519-22980
MLSRQDHEKRLEGDKLMKEGNYRGAAKIFRHLLETLDRDGQGNRYALFHALLCLGDFKEAEQLADKHSADGDELPFLYGYVAIKYLKFKLGYLAEKELDTALIKAFQMNQFVPEYLLLLRTSSGLPEMQNPHSYTVSTRSEALHYVHSAKDVW